MTKLSLDDDLAQLGADLFDGLHRLSADGDGVTRGSYSASENAAHLLFANCAARHGLKTWTDEACNTWIELEGTDPNSPSVVLGSHLDSVRNGGNFDGAAGVVGGLLTMLLLRKAGPLRRSVRTVAFRGEESAWFGTCYIGSRALVGSLTTAMLDGLSAEKMALREAMVEMGANLALIEAGQPLLDLASIALYLELHIEQGPVLVAADIPLGAVTAIRGNVRYPAVEWRGQSGHSGTVPRELRRDAVFGVARWLSEIETIWDEESEAGTDLVVTTGVLETDPMRHGVTRIAEYVRLSLDIRSADSATLRRVAERIEDQARMIASERGLTVEFGQQLETSPASIDTSTRQAILDAAELQGHGIMALPSGAGHDAAALAEVGIPVGMIFVRNENGSHNPS
ncbi:MAG: Zn-dependent hydrolase, partial [Acidimicrobiales bacterium]